MSKIEEAKNDLLEAHPYKVGVARIIKLENIGTITKALDLLSEVEVVANALVMRWNTPNWKDVPNTAEYINSLEKTLQKIKELKGK